MKKKFYLFLIIFLCIFAIVLIYKNKSFINKENIKRQCNLAIIINSDGNEISSKSIPIGNYKLNKEKSHCENNGEVTSYDNVNGKISFSFIGSDRCILYFDEVETEPPVINNLNISGNTVTATLSDNENLAGYALSTSNTVEPTNYTSISGKTYNLSLTITTEGIYYLWVKDKNGNKKISSIIEISKKGWETILVNNGGEAVIKAKGNPDFTQSATTNEGMYAMEDDLGTSYYFRGAVDNNWVKFGKDSSSNDIFWRIIRINGDGSIRMIYTGTIAPTESTKLVMTGEDTQIGESAFNSNNNSSEYVGYMYTIGQQHGLGTSSTIKTTLDNWYKTTTLETDVNTNSLVVDEVYCNDRSASTSENGKYGEISPWKSKPSSYIYYGSHGNNFGDKSNPSPSLKCTNVNDKFTVNSSNGNGALTYPVGLITADEIMLAGANNQGTSNSSYYLYTNQYYWSFSPNRWSSVNAYSFLVGSYGLLNWLGVHNIIGVRPVISISKDAKLSGDGTYNNVYTVNS